METINNWVKIINEENDVDLFLNNTTFQLVSNKSGSSNLFMTNVIKTNNKEVTIDYFLNYLKKLLLETGDLTIKSYIKSLIKLGKTNLKKFISRLKFDLDEDDLIIRIKKRLIEKIHIKEKIDDVFNNLFTELKTKEYLDIKAGNKKIISFEDFNKSFKGCFRVGLSTKLPIRDLKFTLPKDYHNQLFIRQLIDIGDISIHDKDEMVEYTTQMLQLYNNLKKWEEDGDLMIFELDQFTKESVMIWKNSFKSKYREIKNKMENGTVVDDVEINSKALQCLDEMRRAILKIDETILSTELSNGHFYLLTEKTNIGWHYEWKAKY